jgi:hypothetical protein
MWSEEKERAALTTLELCESDVVSRAIAAMDRAAKVQGGGSTIVNERDARELRSAIARFRAAADEWALIATARPKSDPPIVRAAEHHEKTDPAFSVRPTVAP